MLTRNHISEINDIHQKLYNLASDALAFAIRIGELLDKQKESLKRGEWEDWVEANLDFSKSTAERYVRVFLSKDRLKAEGIFELTDAYAKLPKLASKASAMTKSSPANEPLTEQNQPSSTTTSTSQDPPANAPTKKAEKIIEVDEFGTPIPSDALPFWKRKQEAQDLLTQITNIKSTVSKAMEAGDALFAKVSNSVIDDLSRAYTHLLEAKPYAVCTVCMGSFSVQPKGCSMCGNKGLISKWQWDTQSRKEVKEIRLRANAAAAAGA